MNNKPTGPFPIMVDGKPDVGETLTARPNALQDLDGINWRTMRFQWLISETVDGEEVTRELPGQTDNQYVVTHDDRGKHIACRVSYTDKAGHENRKVSDRMSSFAVDNNMRNLSGLYRLALKRDPDGPGLLFWADHYQFLVDNGLTTWDAAEAVVAAFSESDDFARETA